MTKKLPSGTVRKGVRMTKAGPVVVVTKPAKGLVGKLVDKALKANGK
jgi:hypothetical protein